MKKSERLNDMIRYLNGREYFNLQDLMEKYRNSSKSPPGLVSGMPLESSYIRISTGCSDVTGSLLLRMGMHKHAFL